MGGEAKEGKGRQKVSRKVDNGDLAERSKGTDRDKRARERERENRNRNRDRHRNQTRPSVKSQWLNCMGREV